MFQLVSEVRLQEVLAQVPRTASALVGSQDGLLIVLDERNRVVHRIELNPAGPSPELAHVAGSALGMHNLRAHSAGGPTRALGVPIRSPRGFRGQIHVANRADGQSFTRADESLLLSFASVAGAVIDRAQLYEESHQRELWVALQGRIATSLLAGAPAGEVLDLVARGAKELTGADSSTLLVYDGGSTLSVAAADGHDLWRLVGSRLEATGTISGAIVETGEPVVLAEPSEGHGRSEPLLSAEQMGGALFVPLRANGRTTGTLAVGRLSGATSFTQTDFWLLESFASQVSVALEYGRARTELERRAVVDSQERIARELHDTVIQQLFATGMSLLATAKRTSDERTADRIHGAVDALDAVIRDIRSAVFALRMGEQATRGVRAELRSIAQQIFEASDVAYELHFDGPLDTAIDEGVRAHVVASLREALSNVNRHARATRVDVFVEAGRELVLRVLDDGVGIPGGALGAPQSGLRNLRARAEELGGTMTLQSPPAGGTVLEWRVPWAVPPVEAGPPPSPVDRPA